MTRRFLNILTAELSKTKSTSAVLIALFAVAFTTFLVLTNYNLDIQSIVSIGQNPWFRIIELSNSILAFFVITPTVILIISALAFIEQKADSWKLLYTLPISRGQILISRLSIIILLIVSILFTLCITIYLSASFLDWRFPEIEFSFYSCDLTYLLNHLAHTFISLLGLIGIQLFLSYFFKNVIPALSIGFFGFIFGFLLTAGNQKLALYNPYNYSMITQDLKMIRYEHNNIIFGSWITNVELNSIICFSIFLLLTFALEKHKNIK